MNTIDTRPLLLRASHTTPAGRGTLYRLTASGATETTPVDSPPVIDARAAQLWPGDRPIVVEQVADRRQ